MVKVTKNNNNLFIKPENLLNKKVSLFQIKKNETHIKRRYFSNGKNRTPEFN